MTKINMQAVAQEAGVGVATVDRVINGRAPVRAATAEKVLAAAQKLGFHRKGLIEQRLAQSEPVLRLGVMLQKRGSHFYRDLAKAIQASAAAARGPACRLQLVFVDDISPAAVAERMLSLAQEVDVLAVVAADHPLINQAIDRLHAQSVPVVALISNLSANHLAGFVAMDDRKVGRMAAWGVAHMGRGPGPVALLVGSHRYLCQEANEIGFRSYLREHAPELRMLETGSSLEDPQLAQEATLDLLKQHPDLRGLYMAGGGIEGVVEALKASSRPPELVVVGHSLTDLTRTAIIDGHIQMVLTQSSRWMAHSLLDVATQVRGAVRAGHALTQTVAAQLPMETYTQANV